MALLKKITLSPITWHLLRHRFSSSAAAAIVTGEIVDTSKDIRHVQPGDVIDVPYEITVTDTMHDLWQSSFHSQDRIHTSRPFARSMLGLQDRVLPFSLALFLTSSMTHADSAKVQVGFGRVSYVWPAFAGDTFTKRFVVTGTRHTSDGNRSILDFSCELINQRQRVCMTAEKSMLFDFLVAESSLGKSEPSQKEVKQPFRDHLLSKASALVGKSQSLTPLRPGQLILHTMNRTLTLSQMQQLASLVRLTHERHFDIRKYDPVTEILIPGGCVLGLTLSAASRDLHEVLHEEILGVKYVESVHPGNLLGAITYVANIDDNVPGDLESVTVRTIGIKNLDVKRDLDGIELPLELFTTQQLLPKNIHQICKTQCPLLHGKLVVVVDRKIIRQANPHQIFLL